MLTASSKDKVLVLSNFMKRRRRKILGNHSSKESTKRKSNFVKLTMIFFTFLFRSTKTVSWKAPALGPQKDYLLLLFTIIWHLTQSGGAVSLALAEVFSKSETILTKNYLSTSVPAAMTRKTGRDFLWFMIQDLELMQKWINWKEGDTKIAVRTDTKSVNFCFATSKTSMKWGIVTKKCVH